MVQLERQSAQLVELIEDLGDVIRSAMEDNYIDDIEVMVIEAGVSQAKQLAMDTDEANAIGIAIIRTGVVSHRSQRLLRQREDRFAREGRNEHEEEAETEAAVA